MKLRKLAAIALILLLSLSALTACAPKELFPAEELPISNRY